MADNDDKRDDQGAGKRTLTLKGGPALGGGMRPGMGRSARTVVVEKRTRRVGPPGPASHGPNPTVGAPPPRPASPSSAQQGRPPMRSPAGRPGGGGGLTQGENVARERALREAAARQADDAARAAADEARRAEEDTRRRAIREAEESARVSPPRRLRSWSPPMRR